MKQYHGMSVFDEIYGNYYRTIEAVLREAVKGGLTNRRLQQIINENAFQSGKENLPGYIKNDWELLRRDESAKEPCWIASVSHAPEMPLTKLQKSWLKAVLCDPRVRLFIETEPEGLADTEPLFSQDQIRYYDRYADGDPFEASAYIEHFHAVLKGLREHHTMEITYRTRSGRTDTVGCMPLNLEYSERDDAFRLITTQGNLQINMASILRCAIKNVPSVTREPEYERLELELHDSHNALERVMLEFSHMKKVTEPMGKDLYRVSIDYLKSDEKEMVIRILSFGPRVKVLSPESVVKDVRRRLEMQLQLFQRQSDSR